MDENDYDTLRQKNIAERNAVFAELFRELKEEAAESKEFQKKRYSVEDVENRPPRKRRRTAITDENAVSYKNVRIEFRKKYNTRSRRKVAVLNGSNIEDKNEKGKLQILFPWAKPFERTLDLMRMDVGDFDEEEQERKDEDTEEEEEEEDSFIDNRGKKTVYKVLKSKYDPNSIPSVDEITDEMLENVAKRSSLKEYSKMAGTSCHQCRQKTLDTKTVCRSGECIGVRGQFCGPCLRGRYGEDAVQALKDPHWACPPCRGLCNCSICRTRNGLRPTGILAHTVQEEGYTSVMEYLQRTEGNT